MIFFKRSEKNQERNSSVDPHEGTLYSNLVIFQAAFSTAPCVRPYKKLPYRRERTVRRTARNSIRKHARAKKMKEIAGWPPFMSLQNHKFSPQTMHADHPRGADTLCLHSYTHAYVCVCTSFSVNLMNATRVVSLGR